MTRKRKAEKTHITNDTELLNNEGIEEMIKTSERLREYNPTIIYTSDEARAIQSGEILSKSLKIPLEIVKGVKERNWGNLSGKPWSEIQTILDHMSLEERYTYTPLNGESWHDFETRLIKTINEIIYKNSGKTIIIISHGGAIRALMPYLLGLGKEESFKHDPNNASLTVFSHNQGAITLELANDTAHLK